MVENLRSRVSEMVIFNGRMLKKRRLNEWKGRYSCQDFKYDLKNKQLKVKGRKRYWGLNILKYKPIKLNPLPFHLFK